MQIAFAGLGAMGSPMATNLAAAGHTVVGYKRSGGDGAAAIRIEHDLAAALRGADALVTMLPNDVAAREITLQALPAMARGTLHLAMSTISPGLARELTAASTERGVAYVAGTVFGRPNAAAEKSLWIVAAGADADVERCLPLFEAMGRGHTRAGEEPWRANTIKIGGNFLIVSAIEALGEAITLMRNADVSPDTFLEAIGNVFGSPLYENYGAQIAAKRFDPGFKLELGLKDVRLALAEGDAAQTPLPLAGLVRDHLLSAMAHGDGQRDWTALSEVLSRLSGSETSVKHSTAV